ncbi:MAG: hypothetical protein [Arizlama microvirus]|nr:MAG: hypothetical protein [Arizlama microvirus]
MVTDTLRVAAQSDTVQQIAVILQAVMLLAGAILHLFRKNT